MQKLVVFGIFLGLACLGRAVCAQESASEKWSVSLEKSAFEEKSGESHHHLEIGGVAVAKDVVAVAAARVGGRTRLRPHGKESRTYICSFLI